MCRIATVYRDDHFKNFEIHDMSMLRWLRISEALANRGHHVDIIVNTDQRKPTLKPGVNVVSYADVDWQNYDVVKTLFHLGFASLKRAGAHRHPFVVSKLGSVVGADDQTDGVYFFE